MNYLVRSQAENQAQIIQAIRQIKATKLKN